MFRYLAAGVDRLPPLCLSCPSFSDQSFGLLDSPSSKYKPTIQNHSLGKGETSCCHVARSILVSLGVVLCLLWLMFVSLFVSPTLLWSFFGCWLRLSGSSFDKRSVGFRSRGFSSSVTPVGRSVVAVAGSAHQIFFDFRRRRRLCYLPPVPCITTRSQVFKILGPKDSELPLVGLVPVWP